MKDFYQLNAIIAITRVKYTYKGGNKMTQEQLQQTLDWMLAHNVIDYITYNELLLKSLPLL